ncbi:MAG: hypothetical protein U0704_04060 [Candidatus Eisenbacteria bacterium]
MTDLALHFAPRAPWVPIVFGALAVALLAAWAYRFAMPPVGTVWRRVLAVSRALVLVALVALLGQPVLERALPASGRRVTVLVDRSASMSLPERPGGAAREAAATADAHDVAAALRGRAQVREAGFAAALLGDSAKAGEGRDATALGDALAALADLPLERRPDGVVVVSDGVVNAGTDPVAAARALGVPVHTVLVGRPLGADRAVAAVETGAQARVGEATPVVVRVTSDEPRGTVIPVRLLDGERELARGTVSAPGSGAEASVTLRVVPARPGLAVWTASVAGREREGDASPANDARQVAVPVLPGKLGVLVVSSGLQWDLAFLRRALLGDTTLSLATRVRERDGWRTIERPAERTAPAAADLRGVAVVVLDGLAGSDVSPGFDAALAEFVRGGGGLLVLPGAGDGALGLGRGALAQGLDFDGVTGAAHEARPQLTDAAGELLAWDDDPARGAQAWRAVAPLADVQELRPAAGDRVLLESQGGGAPLLLSRRIGRGPVLLLNGTGFWRWSLSANDERAGERARRLWRGVVRWLSEPVQGEPLRVQPERWLSAGGERVRLVATLQDDAFAPVAGATVRGDATDGAGHSRAIEFAPGAPGVYTATLDGLPAGRWQVSARAEKSGREAGRARSEFAVDRWSLEALRAAPDSATMAAIAGASGGRTTLAADARHWAGALETRALTRRRTTSARLWESPWLFAALVTLLSFEWIARRRRGLPDAAPRPRASRHARCLVVALNDARAPGVRTARIRPRRGETHGRSGAARRARAARVRARRPADRRRGLLRRQRRRHRLGVRRTVQSRRARHGARGRAARSGRRLGRRPLDAALDRRGARHDPRARPVRDRRRPGRAARRCARDAGAAERSRRRATRVAGRRGRNGRLGRARVRRVRVRRQCRRRAVGILARPRARCRRPRRQRARLPRRHAQPGRAQPARTRPRRGARLAAAGPRTARAR